MRTGFGLVRICLRVQVLNVMDIKQRISDLHDEIVRAMDFHYPSWWGADERQAHRNRIESLQYELDQLREDSFWWDVLTEANA